MPNFIEKIKNFAHGNAFTLLCATACLALATIALLVYAFVQFARKRFVKRILDSGLEGADNMTLDYLKGKASKAEATAFLGDKTHAR